MIGYLIRKKYITAATGRAIESFIVGMVSAGIIAGLTALSESLSASAASAVDYRVIMTAALTSVGLYIRKALRDADAKNK